VKLLGVVDPLSRMNVPVGLRVVPAKKLPAMTCQMSDRVDALFATKFPQNAAATKNRVPAELECGTAGTRKNVLGGNGIGRIVRPVPFAKIARLEKIDPRVTTVLLAWNRLNLHVAAAVTNDRVVMTIRRNSIVLR